MDWRAEEVPEEGSELVSPQAMVEEPRPGRKDTTMTEMLSWLPSWYAMSRS
jgi:hypothetical protein